MRLFSQIYFLFFLSYNKESNMYKALMHSVIKSKDQFKKQRNGFKISTKPKSIYGGQSPIQLGTTCEEFVTPDTNNMDENKLVKKINKELQYNVKLMKYLYDNDIEFIQKSEDYHKPPGYFICRIIGYESININSWYNEKQGKMTKIPDIRYKIQIVGFIPKTTNSQINLNSIIQVPEDYINIWQNYREFKIKIMKTKPDLEKMLKYLEINFIKCGVAHSKKVLNGNLVVHDMNKTLSIKYDFDNIVDSMDNISKVKENDKSPIKIDNNILQQKQKFNLLDIYYYKNLPNSQSVIQTEINDYFNVCQSHYNIKPNKQFKFIFNKDYFNKYSHNDNDNKNKFINLNKLKLSKDDMDRRVSQYQYNKTVYEEKLDTINKNLKKKAISVIKDFVKSDSETLGNIDEDKTMNNSSEQNVKKMMFLSHNIQNKNGKETNDENDIQGVGISNIFRQYSEMLFGQDVVNGNININKQNDNAFEFTKSMIILLQETNWLAIDETIYGQGDVYYVPCDVANGSLFMYGKTLYGYNTFRSLAKDDNSKTLVYKHIDIDCINYNHSDILEEIRKCKKKYDEKKNKKKSQEGGTERELRKRTATEQTDEAQLNTGQVQTRIGKDQTSKSSQSKKQKVQVQVCQEKPDKTEYIKNYIYNTSLMIDDEKSSFKMLELKYRLFFDFLKKYNENNEIDNEMFLNSIFLRPQFELNYLNFKENEFKGRIMVHDLTDWFQKGLTETINYSSVIHGKISKSMTIKNQRLFAISCDERMNFTNSFRNIDSRNNKTKQLCTIFSSEFFDPRENSDETHVLLIGIGVAGPTKNHVAMVIANKTFEEVVINVHLESAGQGDKANSNEYALAELDVLLNCILGNNIHPFFEKHNNKIKTIRIFSDFNLLSNVIADRLKKFKIQKQFKNFKFNMLLDGVKTHDNVKKINKNSYETSELDAKKINSGCIDNVIYISKVKSIEDNIEKCIIGERKLPSEKYTKDQYDSLSDHSPMIIIENMPSDTASFNKNRDNSPSVIDNRTKYLLNPRTPSMFK